MAYLSALGAAVTGSRGEGRDLLRAKQSRFNGNNEWRLIRQRFVTKPEGPSL